MPRDRLASLIAILVCAVLALPGQANAAGSQNVKVAGAAARIPSECKVGRATAEVFECRWTNADLSYRTFGMFSALEPSFSSLMSEMGMPTEPSKDVGMVLDVLINVSKEGLGGPGDRLVRFEVSPVAAKRLPRGAEACRLVRKSEITHDPHSSTRLGKEERLERRELICAARSGPKNIRSISAILVWTYKPGLGQGLPKDFDAQANGIFGTILISP